MPLTDTSDMSWVLCDPWSIIILWRVTWRRAFLDRNNNPLDGSVSIEHYPVVRSVPNLQLRDGTEQRASRAVETWWWSRIKCRAASVPSRERDRVTPPSNRGALIFALTHARFASLSLFF